MLVATIQKALDTKQIGTPVAVRLHLQAADASRTLPAHASHGLGLACAWLREAPVKLFAHGRDAQVSLLGKTHGGKSLLVSVGLRRDDNPPIQAVVVGNKGILSWNGDPWMEAELPELKDDARLLRQVEQALSVSRSAPISASPIGFQTRNHSTQTLVPPYGVLLVAGDHTHQPGYAEAFASDARCKLIGLTDEDDVPNRRRELNARLAERLGIPLLANLSECLNRSDVHIVSICAEPYRRGRLIVQAAQAGKHLYLDKPLAASLHDSDAIVAAVRQSGVVAHMFSQIHWQPAVRARELVRSGCLGELVAVHCDMCFAKGHSGSADLRRPRQEDCSPQRYELPDAKRELTNVGVYHVTFLLWLLQQSPVRVHATTGNYFFAEHQRNGMEDFGQMLLEFPGGITASIMAGRTGWRSHPGSGLNRIHLVGSKGTVTLDAGRPRVDVWADSEPWTVPPRDPEDPMGMWAPLPDSPFGPRAKQDWILPGSYCWGDDTKHFLDCIQQGKPSDVSAEVAACATEVLLGAYRSAAEQQGFVLPLPR